MGHLSGLTSSLPWDFEDNAYQPAVEGKDDGVRLVKLRGLAFVPCATADIVLEQVPQAPTIEVFSRAFVSLGLQYRAFDQALDWMQASFMAQADSTYTGHTCTR